MLNNPNVLSSKDFDLPDPKLPGNLIFASYCDRPKLVNILNRGIIPRKGNKRTASYFPDVVSLSAVGKLGYRETTGIQIGWLNIINNTRVFEEIDNKNAFCFSFILDPKWIKQNHDKFLAVGAAFDNQRIGEEFLVGSLSDIPVTKNFSEFDGAFYEEIHFLGENIPTSAFKGVIIDEKVDDFERAKSKLKEAIELMEDKSRLKLPIGIYDNKGDLVELIG